MNVELEQWLSRTTRLFLSLWGLASSFAPQVALLYLYLHWYRLSPTITSGYRSPAKQAELLRRYYAGDPSIVYKPARNSKHCRRDLSGNPAAMAVDISTSDPIKAAQIARSLGIKSGISWGDPVHYYI